MNPTPLTPHQKALRINLDSAVYGTFAEIGAGLGASHQTGWTGIVAKLIHQYALQRKAPNLIEEDELTTGNLSH